MSLRVVPAGHFRVFFFIGGGTNTGTDFHRKTLPRFRRGHTRYLVGNGALRPARAACDVNRQDDAPSLRPCRAAAGSAITGDDWKKASAALPWHRPVYVPPRARYRRVLPCSTWLKIRSITDFRALGLLLSLWPVAAPRDKTSVSGPGHPVRGHALPQSTLVGTR